MLAFVLAFTLAAPPVTLEVDATNITRRMVHARLVLPVKSGPLTLVYPKWIPGEHAPSGPLDGVINLQLLASGQKLAWRRDPLEPFALHLNVPTGTTALEVTFDYVSVAEGGIYTATSMATENVGVVSWNQVVFTPQGTPSDAMEVQARLIVPNGWEIGTALRVARRSAGTIDFMPVTLGTLIDSPVNMGRYFRTLDLGDGHAVHLAAESPGALAVPEDTVTEWKQLVAEARALFGNKPSPRYDFLVTLSDHLVPTGVEHSASSDNRLGERTLVTDDVRAYWASLLPHELVHAWNGKYRRAAGLESRDFESPMNDELLWVYEGLTQYLGLVLTARSGLKTPEEWRDHQAFWTALTAQTGGRSWRPLQDTATAAARLYEAPEQWSSARRSVDFYDEGMLLWLEVDVQLRALTGGARSLDDFARAFFEGATSQKVLKPYTFEDVVAALNAIAPADWAGFWRQRLDETGRPLKGFEGTGWKLAWQKDCSPYLKTYQQLFKEVVEPFSLGLVLHAADDTVLDVVPGSSAWAAGVAPGMKVLGLGGRRFNAELLGDILEQTRTSKAPLELLLENAEFYRVVKLDYHGGSRYPVLVRDEKLPDVLSQILAPRTPHAVRQAKKP